MAWLQALSATWRAAEVPAEKADLLHAIDDRIEHGDATIFVRVPIAPRPS